MRFYAVSTEAIQHTHRALAQLDHRRRGSLQPARTMRVNVTARSRLDP